MGSSGPDTQVIRAPGRSQGQTAIRFLSSSLSFFFSCTVLPQLHLALILLFLLLTPPLPPRGPFSHIAQVEVRLLYPPVGRDLLGLVALHVLLHGGEAGAVLCADGALVG